MLFNTRFIPFILLISLSVISCQTTTKLEKKAIESVIYEQQNNWNKGDIEGFMDGYWNSDSLMFIGSRGVTLGWDKTLANYRKGYPNKDKMGTLKFDIIHLNKITKNSYFMMGKYTLLRINDKPTGYFVLQWKLIEGRWRIISDHTVAAD